VLLVLAGNRDGVSFYGYDAICTLLDCTLDDYLPLPHADHQRTA
jgi:DNA-binding Xre family transcriptional regulator